MKASDYIISSEKFNFHSTGENIHDTKLETKPISYFKDAFNRFAKNKASIFATFIIALLVLFAVVVPMTTPYTVSYEDINYEFVSPKNNLFKSLGINFWDGGKQKEVNQMTYDQYRAIEQEIGAELITTDVEIVEVEYMKQKKKLYSFRLDTYAAVGVKFILMTTKEYQALQEYQDRIGEQVIYPITNPDLRPDERTSEKGNANIWYATQVGGGGKMELVYDEQGDLIPIYQELTGKDIYTSKMRVEGNTAKYDYAEKMQGDSWKVRVDYTKYYKYYHTEVLKDGIEEASHLFGATNAGQDVLTRLSSGARFSFILAVIVATVNLFVGAIYGAIEGYYGGKVDLFMERFVDIISAVPSMIVITLLRYHLDVSHVVILFISFFATGWIGMAGRTRMQFYRFKNQEYVLVARTLGAKDTRIMFKHIFPNAIGTLITSCVLVIPGVIFSETSLSYLNIINLNTGNMTSVGTLLATGQQYMDNAPHMILFPSVFISLLMLSFNLFGNGLRDAFNPSLRGAED